MPQGRKQVGLRPQIENMDSPRHRFRREDIDGEGSSEGFSDVDHRLVSIEGELRTVSLSSAMAARDSQALRARVDELERSKGSGGGAHVDTALSKVYDHIETQDDRIEQAFERLQLSERRLQDIVGRIDNFGSVGKLENLPDVLDQTLAQGLDDVEARMESRLVALRASGGGSAEDLSAVRAEIEAKNKELRLQVERLLDKRQNEMVELIENAVRNLRVEDLRQSVTKEMDAIASALADLQEVTEALPTKEELKDLELAAQSGGGSGEDVAELRSQLQSLKTDLGEIKTQWESVRTLFDGENWAVKLGSQLEDMKQSAGILEKHQERVDLAIRLVNQLEEKAKGISFSGGSAVPESGLVAPPGEPQLKLTLRDLMREMVKNRVSDLHIKTGRAITARIGKELIQFSTPPLTPADSFHLIVSSLRPALRKRLFLERDIEFVHQYESIRLRANVFFDRGNLSATFKMLSNRPPELEKLGLPKAFVSLLGRPSGLLLVCGQAGSGKTTTLTAGLDYLNRTRQLHLVSLEDRMDFVHEDRRSLVTQRELGDDIVSYSKGLHCARGQDVDVIFVADLLDKDAVDEALGAVENGVQVVAAVNAVSVEEAITSIVNLYAESERRTQARNLAKHLQGILAQKLFSRADGEGKIPASEMMVATAAVKKLIEDANLSALRSQIAGGAADGMQSFSQSIERLRETGMIRVEDSLGELERVPSHSHGGTTADQAIRSSPAQAAPAKAAPAQAAPSHAPAAGQQASQPQRPSTPVREAQAARSALPPSSKPPEPLGEEDTLMNWL